MKNSQCLSSFSFPPPQVNTSMDVVFEAGDDQQLRSWMCEIKECLHRGWVIAPLLSVPGLCDAVLQVFFIARVLFCVFFFLKKRISSPHGWKISLNVYSDSLWNIWSKGDIGLPWLADAERIRQDYLLMVTESTFSWRRFSFSLIAQCGSRFTYSESLALTFASCIAGRNLGPKKWFQGWSLVGTSRALDRRYWKTGKCVGMSPHPPFSQHLMRVRNLLL